MSKTKRPYAHMHAIAAGLVERLRPACHRIEIAGSIRRKAAEVGDIELIAVPIAFTDLFGNPTDKTMVDLTLEQWPVELTKNGQKYKQFVFAGKSGHTYQVDLFLQPDPATWGVNYMIRTGPEKFSKRMVTRRNLGGLMPDDLHVRDARIWRNGFALETPEELDVFTLYGIDYIAPEERT